METATGTSEGNKKRALEAAEASGQDTAASDSPIPSVTSTTAPFDMEALLAQAAQKSEAAMHKVGNDMQKEFAGLIRNYDKAAQARFAAVETEVRDINSRQAKLEAEHQFMAAHLSRVSKALEVADRQPSSPKQPPINDNQS